MAANRPLRVGWVYDEARHKSLNAQGRNYWHRYTEEILSRLGAAADALPVDALASAPGLDEYSILIVGGLAPEALPDEAEQTIRSWVQDGGVLIGFACEGLDDVFGVESAGRWEQTDEFSICGYLKLLPDGIGEGIHSELHPDQPLAAVSPIRLINAEGARQVAQLLSPDSDEPGRGKLAHDTPHPAITDRALGSGRAYYFAFDVAQTMWAIHQGRPIDADHDGDGYLRAMDARLIAANEREVGYTDELHLLLQSMIGQTPAPMVHQIPPLEGQVADILIYFGGDDEGTPENQIMASEFMHARGLPYHINCMPDKDGQFAMTAEEIERIEANGHELSMHYDFITDFDHPSGFTEEDIKRQSDAFKALFGRPAVCSVNHWVRWVGWCEPARWMAAQGQLGDNSWIGLISPPTNPVNNIDLSFGTAFPRRPWDDWRYGNEPIEFVEEHIVAYEVGYLDQDTDLDKLREAIDLARRYRLTASFFYHPVYIARFPACQAAIDEMVRYVAERGIRTVFMGSDEVARWWIARSKASVSGARETADGIAFDAECDYSAGFVVKLSIGQATGAEATVDGGAAPVEISQEFGANWAFIALEPGKHEVTVTLS